MSLITIPLCNLYVGKERKVRIYVYVCATAFLNKALEMEKTLREGKDKMNAII